MKPQPARRWRSGLTHWIAALAIVATLLTVLRLVRLLEVPWVLALAPATIVGAIVMMAALWAITSPLFPARGSGAYTVTPPPDQLEAPVSADAGQLRVLGEHPEILAALCHGFRMHRLQPTVLGRPVTDPWGVYAAALVASPMELDTLAMIARKHAQRLAAQGREAMGRGPSDAHVMKQAVQQFHRCAAQQKSGRGNPDCPFEHITVVFGTRSPNRDEHLRSLAPRVRALLEKLYPQLATARLEDGSAVKYGEWQQRATDDKHDLVRLRRERGRQEDRIARLERELAAAAATIDRLETRLETERARATTAARLDQEKRVRELNSALDVARHEHARDAHRAELEHARLLATVEALATERDELERLLLVDPEANEAGDLTAQPDLAGCRVLLVGGNPGHLPPIKDLLEPHAIQLLHHEDSNATQLVAGADLVVLWTRFMTHSTYFAVKRECRARGVPYCHWIRTSPASLLTEITRHASRPTYEDPTIGAPTAHPRTRAADA